MKIRFADYILDSKRCELHRGSEPIAAEPQVFYLLVHLVQNGWPYSRRSEKWLRTGIIAVGKCSQGRYTASKATGTMGGRQSNPNCKPTNRAPEMRQSLQLQFSSQCSSEPLLLG
jgi:hypothetical protein